MTEYSNRLRNLRKEKGLTQDELAEKLNTSRSRISMYEQGKRQPDFEMQESIADFFNVNLDYLFGKSDDDERILLELYRNGNAAYKAHLIEYAKKISELMEGGK